MSEARKTSQQTLAIGLGVIAVLLAAIVGLVIYFQNQNSIPAPTAQAGTGTQSTAASTPAAPAGMGTGSTTPAAFDTKTATKVPQGTDPADFVKAYHVALDAGKYAEAYKMLPLDKQQSYGDAKAYQTQLESYGITGYKLGKATTKGDTMSIPAEQITPQMPITYTWNFKKVSGVWYVESRVMGGSVQ